MVKVRQVEMSWHQFWNDSPEGYVNPRTLPNGAPREYCVRYTKKNDEGRMYEAEVVANDFHHARMIASGGDTYSLDASVVFEKYEGD